MKFDRQRFIDDLRYLATLDCKWLHQGRSPETGMDCVFSPRWAVERQGIQLPKELADEFEHYHRPPDGVRMMAVMRKWFQEVEPSQAIPGDLLVARVGKRTSHVLIKISETEIAEAYESVDGSVSKFLIRPMPHYRIAACFRIPDFA